MSLQALLIPYCLQIPTNFNRHTYIHSKAEMIKRGIQLVSPKCSSCFLGEKNDSLLTPVFPWPQIMAGPQG